MTQLDLVTRKLSLFPLTPIVLSQLIQLYKMYIYIYIYIYIYTHYSSRIVDDLWKRRNETSRAIPLHQVSTKLETNVVDILPALHALTGCDD